MSEQEITREAFTLALSPLSLDEIDELWEDGYSLDEAREYLSWREERQRLSSSID